MSAPRVAIIDTATAWSGNDFCRKIMPAALQSMGCVWTSADIDGTAIANEDEASLDGCIVIVEAFSDGTRAFLDAPHPWPVLVQVTGGPTKTEGALDAGLTSGVSYGARETGISLAYTPDDRACACISSYAYSYGGIPDTEIVYTYGIDSSYVRTKRHIMWRHVSYSGGDNIYCTLARLAYYSPAIYLSQAGIAVPHPVQLWIDIDDYMEVGANPHCVRELGEALRADGAQICLGHDTSDAAVPDVAAAVAEYADEYCVTLHDHARATDIYASSATMQSVADAWEAGIAEAEEQFGHPIAANCGGYIVAPGNGWSDLSARTLYEHAGLRYLRGKISTGIMGSYLIGKKRHAIYPEGGYATGDYDSAANQYNVIIVPCHPNAGQYNSYGNQWLWLLSGGRLDWMYSAGNLMFGNESMQMLLSNRVMVHYLHGPQLSKHCAGYVGLLSQPSNGDTIKIDDVIYEMRSDTSWTAGMVSVPIGADVTGTRNNLYDAIDAEQGSAGTELVALRKLDVGDVNTGNISAGAGIEIVPADDSTTIVVERPSIEAARITADDARMRCVALEWLDATMLGMHRLCAPNVIIATADDRAKILA